MNREERTAWVKKEHAAALASLRDEGLMRVFIASRALELADNFRKLIDAIPPELPKDIRDEFGELISQSAVTLSHIVLVWTAATIPEMVDEVPHLLALSERRCPLCESALVPDSPTTAHCSRCDWALR